MGHVDVWLDDEVNADWIKRGAETKGDVAGHDFHGNQWTGGHGGGGNASEVRMHTEEFKGAGGRIREVGQADAERLAKDVDAMGEKLRQSGPWVNHGDSLGIDFTRVALETVSKNNYGDGVNDIAPPHAFVAETKDGQVAGAIGIMDGSPTNPDNVYVEFLGSTHVAEGSGSALVAQATQFAAERGKGIEGDPIYSAMKFWQDEVGWHHMGEDGSFGLTADETKKMAEALK